MKRFFTVVGFSFIFSLLLLNNIFSEYVLAYIIVALLLFSVCLIFRKKFKIKELSCVFLSCAVSAVLFACVTEFSYKPNTALAGVKSDIKAVVIDLPTVSSGGNYSYLIKTETVNAENKKIRMRLYTPYDICADPYDEIEFSAYPFVLGENDEAVLKYFKAKRTYLGAYTKFYVAVHEPEKKPLISFFTIQKGRSEANIRKYLNGDHAEFAVSILFGDKTYLSDETYENFKISGLSHIMAVSGLHMSVWIMGLFFILRKLHFDDRVSGSICIFACVCLVFFCAFSMSVIRTAIMLTVYFSAHFFRRKADSLNSLGLAAFVICAVDPYAVCDVSFLLSFSASLGIIVFSLCYPLFSQIKENERIHSVILRYALDCIFICISANIFMVPIMIRYFSSLSTWVLISNLAVFFAVAPCLLLSGMLSVCPDIKIIAYPIRTLLYTLEKYIFFICEKVCQLPFSQIMSENLILRLTFPLLIIFSVCVLYIYKRKEFGVTVLLVAFSAVLVLVT